MKIEKKRHDIVLPKDEVLIHLAEDETFEKVINRNMNVLVGEVSIKEYAPGKYDYSICNKIKSKIKSINHFLAVCIMSR